MIKVLEPSLINKIAAGEVVESPASVVKELLENAFDAGADEIRIDVIDSGFKKIKITDNGSGMSYDDALLSFKRHATSKIKDERDLFSITSLGFRGEALAAISEVSHFTLKTKQRDNSLGAFIEVEAGKLLNVEDVAASDGTTVEVNDLFFNVPVRREYVQSKEREFSKIVQAVTSYALLRKHTSLNLYHNNKEIINSPKTNSLLNNIIYVYGSELGRELMDVSMNLSGIQLEGYVSKPSFTRSHKGDQSIYVNNRAIKNDEITQMVYDSMKTLLFTQRHPVFVLHFQVDPKEIDVNVHPQKTTIRIKNLSLFKELIEKAMQEAIRKHNLVPQETVSSVPSVSSFSEAPVKHFTTDTQSILPIEQQTKPQSLLEESLPEKPSIFGEFNILGQVHQSFVILENREGMIVVDQHAAEERVNYETFMKQLRDKAIKKQQLVEGKVLDLSPFHFSIAEYYKELLEKLGFEFEFFGGNSVKLIAIPEIFGRLKSTIFVDVLQTFSTQKEDVFSKEIEDRIIRFACRASVKAGDPLQSHEIRNLLKKLELCENPYTCPHGRPTMFTLTLGELEKKFKRTGW